MRPGLDPTIVPDWNPPTAVGVGHADPTSEGVDAVAAGKAAGDGEDAGNVLALPRPTPAPKLPPMLGVAPPNPLLVPPKLAPPKPPVPVLKPTAPPKATAGVGTVPDAFAGGSVIAKDVPVCGEDMVPKAFGTALDAPKPPVAPPNPAPALNPPEPPPNPPAPPPVNIDPAGGTIDPGPE